MKNKILIVHPSRGRPQKALDAYNDHMNLCSAKEKVTYIVSIDVDDTTLNEYQKFFDSIATVLINPNKGCVDATNRAYSEKIDEYDFIILTSDDMRLCKDWDVLLYNEFNKYGYDKCIKTYQPHGNPNLLMLQIGGSQFFKDYGTFFWPEYISVYADQDISRWAKVKNRWVQANHIICPHLHPRHGLSEWDETYARENSHANMRQGGAIFERRCQEIKE